MMELEKRKRLLRTKLRTCLLPKTKKKIFTWNKVVREMTDCTRQK